MEAEEVAEEAALAEHAVTGNTKAGRASERAGNRQGSNYGNKLTAVCAPNLQNKAYEDDFEGTDPQCILQDGLHVQLHQDEMQPAAEQGGTSPVKAASACNTTDVSSTTTHTPSSTDVQHSFGPHVPFVRKGIHTSSPIARRSSIRPSTAELLTRARPLSAQLRIFKTSLGPNRTSAPTAADVTGKLATQGVQQQSRSPGRSAVPQKPRRFSPGPGSYSPQSDRRGELAVIGNCRGSFCTAARYEGSYIQAFAKTLHGPGPIYYPENGGRVISRSGGRSRAGTAVSHSINVSLSVTAHATHSMLGSWGRADVGSREQLPIHRCRSASPTGRQDTTTPQHYYRTAAGRQGCRSCTTDSSTTSERACTSSSSLNRHSSCSKEDCPGCSAAVWSVPGPGRYNSNVGRDGRGVLVTQSCPAYTLTKARKLVSGRRSPVVSKQHAAHDNEGADSPGPVYYPDIRPVRPSSCSPTMLSRGTDHWELLHNSTARSPTAKQLLGPDAISRNSNHLLGDGPRTIFGSASLEDQHWPHISNHHSRVLYSGRHSPDSKYKLSYSQVDPHVGTRLLSSGPDNRFDDVSHLSYITHAAGANRVQ